MDNQFNNDDYNNKNQFNVYNQRKNKRKSKHDFGLGAFTGVVCTLLVMIIIVGAVFVRFYQAGYIHIATNGQIYIQDIASSASNGIGSEVEAKLNAMDSVLDTFYFDDVDEETAKDNIYKAYLSSYGDKYTVYYTADEYKSLLESTTGKFSGIGAVCQKMDNGTILITEAYEEAPAYKAGIRKGDYVSKVDGQDITDMDLSTAVALIKGEKGTSVHLEVIRDDTTFECDVVRDDIDIRTVS